MINQLPLAELAEERRPPFARTGAKNKSRVPSRGGQLISGFLRY